MATRRMASTPSSIPIDAAQLDERLGGSGADAEGVMRGAVFSGCRRYRPLLWRRWECGPTITFIGLNPSSADERSDDPTIRRCMGYARDWGYGTLLMVNLFDARATLPSDLRRQRAPLSRAGERHLDAACRYSDRVIAAWGNHGRHLDRASMVRRKLDLLGVDMQCFGLTGAGEPRHPLYLRREATANLRY